MPTKDQAEPPYRLPTEIAAEPAAEPFTGSPRDDPPDPPELAEDDEALLRSFGQWLHERDAADASPAELELVVGPSPPPLSAAELEARVDVLLRPRRRRLLRSLLSHAGVAAATVALVQVIPWSAVTDRADPGARAEYSVELRGGDGRTFAPSEGGSVYAPDSVFELKLRPDRTVHEPTEVVVAACREGSQCDTGVFRVRLGPELLAVNDRGVLHFEAPVSSVLPLAPGRWALTFEVGEPGACLRTMPERPCREVGRAVVELRGRGGDDAP